MARIVREVVSYNNQDCALERMASCSVRVKNDGGIPGLEPVSRYYHKRLMRVVKGNLPSLRFRQKVDLGRGDSVLSSALSSPGYLLSNYPSSGAASEMIKADRSLGSKSGSGVELLSRTGRDSALCRAVAGLQGGFSVSIRGRCKRSSGSGALLTPSCRQRAVRAQSTRAAQVSNCPVAVRARCLSSNWKSAWSVGAWTRRSAARSALLGAKSYNVGKAEGEEVEVGFEVLYEVVVPCKAEEDAVLGAGRWRVTWSGRAGRAIEGSGAAWKSQWVMWAARERRLQCPTKPKSEIFTQEV
ncbi:hypothetical protein B0H13DRAFT_1903692 [Mycena leptocephala]|nr:hypothetical protein B0H13DRAFT_1903692 [Mycena leptocephala]